MKFIDEVKVTIASGKGGQGCVSFRREAMTPRGGPDGGDGGRGGDLILKVATNLNSLMDYRRNKKYAAQNGQQGGGSNCSGPTGNDLVLNVPPGTLIRNLDGEIVVDMTDIREFVLLKGGRGGKGNTHFRNSVNQAPEYAQPGEPGVSMEVKMELKMIADVGIVGFPNAGKSTLISRISSAKPKIADYAFTTLTPNLGVVQAGDFKTFVVADIPGLIKGASAGAGLGIQFLKHIERTRLFIHLIDVSGYATSDAVQDYKDINHELDMYDLANSEKDGFFPLSSRKQMVVFSKIDAVPEDVLTKLLKKFETETGIRALTISAVTGKNIESLVFEVSQKIFAEENNS